MSKKIKLRPEWEIEAVEGMIDQIEGLSMDGEECRKHDPEREMRYRETLYSVCAAAKAKLEEIRVELAAQAKARAAA